MRADDKAGDDALRQFGVGVGKGQRIGPGGVRSLGGFVLRHQVGQVPVRRDGVGQFKALHQLENQVTVIGCVIVQDAANQVRRQPSRRCAARLRVGQQAVDGVRHPVGVQHAVRAERFAVFAEIEHHAQFVQQRQQGVLVFLIGDVLLSTQVAAALVGDDRAAGLLLLQRGLDPQVGLRKAHMHVRQGCDRLREQGAQVCDAALLFGGGLQEAKEGGEVVLQAVVRQVEHVLPGIGVIADNDNRRIAAEGADGAQPVLDAVLLIGLADVEDEDVDAARRKEERVAGVHKVLPTEIPQVGGVRPERQAVRLDSERAGAVFLVGAIQQAVSQRGLAGGRLAGERRASPSACSASQTAR